MGKQAIDIGGIGKEFLIFMDDFAEMLGYDCVESITRHVKDGQLPPPIKIGNRNAWTSTTLREYLNERARAAISRGTGENVESKSNKSKDTKSRILELEQA